MLNFLTSIKIHVLIFKTPFTYIEAGKTFAKLSRPEYFLES